MYLRAREAARRVDQHTTGFEVGQAAPEQPLLQFRKAAQPTVVENARREASLVVRKFGDVA